MTMSAKGERESLKYRSLGSDGDIGSWGYAYVRNLTREIAQEYAKRQREETPTLDLIDLAQPIVAFYMKHNAEHKAVDLSMELIKSRLKTEDLYLLGEYGNQHVNTTNFHRICLYLRSAARYLPRPDDMHFLDIAHIIYLKFGAYANALQISLLIDNKKVFCLYVKQVFASCGDVLKKHQPCFMLARHVGFNFLCKCTLAVDCVLKKHRPYYGHTRLLIAFCLQRTALAGLITVLHACLDIKAIILGNFHFVLYSLVLEMRVLLSFGLTVLLVASGLPVRVGQAVDVVCRAGQPRAITGFRNHLTPIVLAAGERAEPATEGYLPLSPFPEGFVILKENPNYRGPKSEKSI